MKIRVKYVYSDFLKKEELLAIINRLKSHLQSRGIELSEADEKDCDAFLIITGGTEQETLDLLNQKDQVPNQVNLLCHDGNNSLAASLEISAFLQSNGKHTKVINLQDENIALQLEKALSFQLPLAGKRVGVIGKPSDWLIASSHSKETVINSWGLELVDISLQELMELIHQQLINAELPEYTKVIEPERKDLLNSMAAYLALKEIINKYNLDGLTIRCFDLVSKQKITACYALAKLNAEGIPAGCEGDIPSITGMLWVKDITGTIPWMANPSSIDSKSSKLILAHCTAPLNYLNNVTLRSHFETGLAVGIEGDLKFSEVTILRLGGKYLNTLWTSKGKVLRTLKRDNLCRTQIEVELPNEKLSSLITSPLGNHLLIIPGNYIDLLSASHLIRVY